LTLAGTVRWAVVPYAPRPPFRLYAGQDHPPIEISDPGQLFESARGGGDAELTYLVPGKVRPVLILNESTEVLHREVTALRLLRLSKLEPEERERVRRQEEPLLFHLDPARFDLPEESAAIVSALVRLNVDAVDTGADLGELNPNESRVIGERIIGFYGFDTRLLIERRVRELAARRR
jgi:hypothetical protein